MADLITVLELDHVAIETKTNELLEVDGDMVSIVESLPILLEAHSTAIELVIINDSPNIVITSDPLALISDVAVGGMGVDIYDEGGLVARGVTELNFVGNTVRAKDEKFGRVTVFIPEPSYLSHYNTFDGLSDCKIADTAVHNRVISLPTTEGAPFKVGNWNANQIHQVTAAGLLSYQATAPCSIFDLTTTFTVSIISEDGLNTLSTFTTPPLTTNGVFSSPDSFIMVNLSGWGEDVDKYQAQVAVIFNLALALPAGGRFGISIMHNNSIDGVFSKVQNHLFYDPNTRPVDIGNVAIAQKWANSFRYLSGIRYYAIGDAFDIGIYGLSNLNSNSYPQPFVEASCVDYGIDDFQVSSDALSEWTPQWDCVNAFYEGLHNITRPSIRFVGDASISVGVLDWGIAKTAQSPATKILIDTYPQSSDPLNEYFEDEYYRQNANFNDGFPDGNWQSDLPLQQGDAMVFGGQLIAPSEAHTIDHKPPENISTWYDYKPFTDSGNPNPDYSTLVCPINYYRTFIHTDPYREIANWQIYVDGEFVNGNVNEDILAGLIQIFMRRVDSTMTTNIGPNATPLTVHGRGYSYGDFDDGVTEGCVWLGNSQGNMIGCTAGGTVTVKGIHFHIKIFDPRIKLERIQFEFN